MEAEIEGRRLTRRPSLACSWDAAGGALEQNLLVAGAGLGAPDSDSDWDELLAPPAPGQDSVTLKQSPKSQGENPCFLYLRCDPDAGEEIVSVGVLSSARNMEVYLGEEYCGTGRGRAAGKVLGNREHEIVFYKKYLKLEPSTLACKIKLLSLGEKQRVLVSRVVVHMGPSSAAAAPHPPAAGGKIDLQRVQTVLEALGSKLSPAAQQLLSMVRCQQQNCVPAVEQLRSVLGNTACTRMTDLWPSSPSGAWSPSSPAPLQPRVAPQNGTEDSNTHSDHSPQPPGGGSSADPKGRDIVPQNHSPPESSLESAVQAFLPQKAAGSSSIPTSELLPFLQTLCSQVNGLRGARSPEWPGSVTKPSDGTAGVAMGEQRVCSYLEKVLSKNMELMEKKLLDYIDQRVCELQEHIDDKLALLMDLLQNASSPHTGAPLRHSDSGERLSNGER